MSRVLDSLRGVPFTLTLAGSQRVGTRLGLCKWIAQVCGVDHFERYLSYQASCRFQTSIRNEGRLIP